VNQAADSRKEQHVCPGRLGHLSLLLGLQKLLTQRN